MQIMVDTSVWVDFFRHGGLEIEQLLEGERVLMHPMVLGELALGYLSNREEVLDFLSDLSMLPMVSNDHVLEFINTHQLMGRGIGWVDAHLLTAVCDVENARLWTQDKRLKTIAESLSIAYLPH